jgi:tRNA A37 N6-isopentenylltransferase MiaA
MPNPFFGKDSTKAFKEACEENDEDRTKRMNELHYTNYKPSSKQKNRRKTRKV